MQALDFSALNHNAAYFKNLLGSSRLCAVVKNNAYGHGAEHIARVLDAVVDCFAVGSVSEARHIDFVKHDILILLPQDEANAATAIMRGYVLTADSFATLNAISNATRKLQQNARVHIKVDSGMSRLGFGQNDIKELLIYLQVHPQIVVEGVYSHFYGENCAQCDKQLNAFLPCAQAIEDAQNRRLIKHIANTNGALLGSKYHLDMARIGLGLYGYGCDELLPVKMVTAQVIAVKDVNANSAVGYGPKRVVERDTKVAVLNVGYAHGFVRPLVNVTITINGANCKVLAVCMAMIIVDVSGLDVNVGDAATVLGNGVNIANDSVSVYELLCNLK